MTNDDIQVVVLPDGHYGDSADDRDPGTVVFDENGTPILEWCNPGWVLFYLEATGNGVERHYIGGELNEVDWALDTARSWLREELT